MVIISSLKYSGHIEREKLNAHFPAIADDILKKDNHPFVSALFIDGNERTGKIDLAIMNAEHPDEVPAELKQSLTAALQNLIES